MSSIEPDLITAVAFPFTGPYSVAGEGLHKGPTALALKRAMARMGHLPWEPRGWDDHFNQKLEAALDAWDPGKNGYAEGRWNRVRAAEVPDGRPHEGEPALDSIAIGLVRREYYGNQTWSGIGPVFNGGSSVLQHDCTHATSGLPLFPAFDDAFRVGIYVIAPEPLTITKVGYSSPGRSIHADGISGVRWWFGHLSSAPSSLVGRTFAKGMTIGTVALNSIGGGPHVHVGVNVENLWGVGQELIHKTSYQHGAPTIGWQLARGAPL